MARRAAEYNSRTAEVRLCISEKYGQNFLIDPHVLDKIVAAAGIGPDDFVVEIGPGIGTLTQYLAYAARSVCAVEIDKNLIPILEDTLSDYDNVEVINNDVLKVDLAALAKEKNNGRPIKVVANLPYYITTPIIMGLFENHVPVDSITVMVQKEVADRMQTGRDRRITGRCRWLCSIMRSRILWRMCRRTVLCRGRRLEVR